MTEKTTDIAWELRGTVDLSKFLKILPDHFPEATMVFAECSAETADVVACYARFKKEGDFLPGANTIFPVSHKYGCVTSREFLDELAALAAQHAEPELFGHFFLYKNEMPLLQWFDACDAPIYLSSTLSQERVKAFAEALGVVYHRDESGSRKQGASCGRPLISVAAGFLLVAVCLGGTKLLGWSLGVKAFLFPGEKLLPVVGPLLPNGLIYGVFPNGGPVASVAIIFVTAFLFWWLAGSGLVYAVARWWRRSPCGTDREQEPKTPFPLSDEEKRILGRFAPSRDDLLNVMGRLIDDDMLLELARADYGNDEEEHHEALKKIRKTGIIPIPLKWCPREVLELMRWSEPENPKWKPGATGRRGHVIRGFACAALLRSIVDKENANFSGGENSTLIQMLASALVLGREVQEAAASFISWVIPKMNVDDERPFFVYGLLLLAFLLKGEVEEIDFEQMSNWVIKEEAFEREALGGCLPKHAEKWLLGLTFHDLKQEAWLKLTAEMRKRVVQSPFLKGRAALLGIMDRILPEGNDEAGDVPPPS